MNPPITAPRQPRRLVLATRALAAAALLAGLLAGLPWVLLRCAALLDMTHLPSWGELAAELTGPPSVFTLMRILVLAGWVLWLLICAQTLYEAGWCATRLPHLLKTGTPAHVLRERGTLTGALVAAIVIGLLSLPRPSHALASTPQSALPRPSVTVSAPADPAPRTPSPRVTSETRNSPADVCEVLPGDTLWDLAERHLGNPLRWKEIYDFNTHRLQNDGQRLSNPDLIYPGWTLSLPTGQPSQPAAQPRPNPPATGSTAPVTPPRVPTTPAPPNTPAPLPSTPKPGSSPAATPITTPPTDQEPAPATATPTGVQLPGGAGYLALSVGIALSAAAVARTLHRRRTYNPGHTMASAHDGPAQPENSPLAAALRRATRLHPGNPSLANSQDLPIATQGSRQLGLLDLLGGRTHSILAIDGPGAHDAARALLAAAFADPDSTELIIPDPVADQLAPGLDSRRPWSGCTHTPDVDGALNVLEERLLTRGRQQADATEQAEGAGQSDLPPVVAVLGDIDHRHEPRLAALLTAGRTRGLAAVLLTAVPPHTAAAMTVGEGGQAEFHQPPENTDTPMRLFSLSTAAAEILLSLVPEKEQTDSGGRADLEEGVSHGQPAASEEEFTPKDSAQESDQAIPENSQTSPNADPVDYSDSSQSAEASGTTAPLPPARTDPAQPAPAGRGSGSALATSEDSPRPAHLRLLGQPAVTVKGEVVTRGLVGYAGELLALLAVHPAGMTKQAILEAIWPERSPAAATQAFNTAKTSIRTALRNALEATTSVNAVLTTGELSRLNTQLISTDLAEFHAASRACAAASDAASRLAAQRRVADLYTGEVCSGADYEWIEPAREDARRRALDALGALAAAAAPDDPEAAIAFLDQAIGLDRYNEQLHLRLAQLQAALGRPDAVRLTSKRLASSLGELSEKPTPVVARAFHDLLHPTSVAARPAPRTRPPHRPAAPAPSRGGRP